MALMPASMERMKFSDGRVLFTDYPTLGQMGIESYSCEVREVGI
jgi:hypothetical protein